jgi:hypothetical protein
MTATQELGSSETAASGAGPETNPAARGRRGRLQRRLDEVIEEVDAHLYRCEDCLVHANDLCYEGAYARDEVEIARAAILRFELAHLPAPIATERSRLFSFGVEPT